MGVQNRNDVTVRKAKLRGTSRKLDSAVFAQAVGGSAIVTNTVVAKDSTSNKWVALTDLTATDGTEVPRGIYIGPGISETDIQAGDVNNQLVVFGGESDWDLDMIVFQNSILPTSRIVNQNMTVEDALAQIGIFLQSVEYTSEVENV